MTWSSVAAATLERIGGRVPAPASDGVDMERVSNRRRRRALVPALALALACAACGSGVVGTAAPTPVPTLSAAGSVRQALLDLAEAGVLRYRGGLVTTDGKQLGLDVRVTSTGEADGTVTLAGQRGALVVVDRTLYVDAPPAFWSALAGDPGTGSPSGADRWVTVPTSALGIDLGAVLAPDALSSSLAAEVNAADRAPLAGRPTTTVAGAAAMRVDIADGTVYLAAAAPHGVLHVDVPANLGSVRNVSLDVDDATPDAADVYRDLVARAGQLSTAVDTNVDIQQGNQTFGACTAVSCTLTVTVTNAGSAPARVVIDGSWTGDGQPAGTCETITGPVAAGRSLTTSCVDATPAWTAFVTRAHSTAGQHPYEVDWTAQALAAPPNLTALAAEDAAAERPAERPGGPASVYVIHYRDDRGRARVWKYGVTLAPLPAYAGPQLTACRAATRTSCTADPVTAADSRQSADALADRLVTAAKAADGGCPPGQWVDC